MTDKEKILANIEFLLNETNYEPFTDEVFGRIQSLKELKSYIDSLQEEPVSEKLEEAAKRYATEGDEISGLYIIDEEVDAFIAGAEWQKKQMMKDAVSGQVCGRVQDHINIKAENGQFLTPPNIMHIIADKSRYKLGDKVKVIIIKED